MLDPVLQITDSRALSMPVIPVHVKPAANWREAVKTFSTDLIVSWNTFLEKILLTLFSWRTSLSFSNFWLFGRKNPLRPTSSLYIQWNSMFTWGHCSVGGSFGSSSSSWSLLSSQPLTSTPVPSHCAGSTVTGATAQSGSQIFRL